MSRRNYNVFFNTHTVSGIVISVALYVIFFAGAFALFREEIKVWQNSKSISHIEKHTIDFDRILEHVNKTYDLRGRDIQLRLGNLDDEMSISLTGQKDTITGEIDQQRQFLFIDTGSLEVKRYEEQYHLGEFLFRLHYFSQIPYIGIYLAGFVAIFFLFAIVTGVIVHWRKIISNFYQFNPKVSLKRIWTDAHTALGIIGLPYQFIFAVTGAYFGLSLLVLLPANFLYNGDQDKLIADLRPDIKTYEWLTTSNETIPALNPFVKETVKIWDNFSVTRCFIKNYGGTNMKFIITGELKDSKRFIGLGSITYDVFSGKKEQVNNPYESDYLAESQRLLGRLHFATFGGVVMKIMYFILALITCFVIISGVLIWIEARNKKSMTLRQRYFTAKVGHIYIASTLTMLPVTALTFLFVKFTNGIFKSQQTSLYLFYFFSWFVFILYFRYKRDNYFTNKITLLLGAILGFLVPLVNGVFYNNWIWNTYKNQQFEILTIDLVWLGIALIAIIIYFKIKPSIKEESSFTKAPLDFKNRKKLLEAAEINLKPTETKSRVSENNNQIPMKLKIIILWIFLAIGWIVHHIYGLFNIYYNETLIIEGATGKVPLAHHIYRILFEGVCLLFTLLTIEVSKRWFKIISLIWAIIAGIYNVYHFFEAIIHESNNISEIFMLLLVSIASVFLIVNLMKWKSDKI